MSNRLLHILKCALATLAVALLFVPDMHVLLRHEDSHAHETRHGECSVELENDACHRKAVHHEGITSCEHDGHLSDHHDHCELCDWLTTRIYTLPDDESSVSRTLVWAWKSVDDPTQYLAEFSLIRLGRAPPSLS